MQLAFRGDFRLIYKTGYPDELAKNKNFDYYTFFHWHGKGLKTKGFSADDTRII